MRTPCEKTLARLKRVGDGMKRAFAAFGSAVLALSATWLSVFQVPKAQRVQRPPPRLTSDDVTAPQSYEWKNDTWPQPPLFTHRRTSYKVKIAARRKEDER